MSDAMRHRALTELLVQLFTHEELERFVAHGPQGDEVRASLRSGGSLKQYAFETTNAWRMRGLIDDALFDLLVAERPARVDEIRWIQHRGPPPGEFGSYGESVLQILEADVEKTLQAIERP